MHEKRGWLHYCTAVLDFLIAQWFVIGIGIVIALAHSFPNVGREGGIIKAQYTISYFLVAIIFFISGLTLPLKDLYKRGADWKLHLVTQGTSFLLFPTIVFAIVSCVKAADPSFERINKYVAAGLLVMSCLPTTVSSNVVMTGQAGGDQSAATIEVILGNLIGTFLSPFLVTIFFSAPGWEFATPQASGTSGTTEIYRQVSAQLGYGVFIPLFVGEVVQYIWSEQVKWFRITFRLSKVGSMCLLGVIWSTFSGAFYAGAFNVLSASTLVFLIFTNIGLYLFFTLLLFFVARKVNSKPFAKDQPMEPLFDASTTCALLFCGAAKGIVLGGPVVQILYGGLSPLEAGITTIPLVLYQGSQVVLGQVTAMVMKNYITREKIKELEIVRLKGLEEEKELEDGVGKQDGEDVEVDKNTVVAEEEGLAKVV